MQSLTRYIFVYILTGRRYHTSVVLADNAVLVLGGEISSWGTNYVNEIWKSTSGGTNWILLTNAAWSQGKPILYPYTHHSLLLYAAGYTLLIKLFASIIILRWSQVS